MRTQKLDLDRREFSSWWAPFEQELIRINQQEHIGWAVPTSNKTFKLKFTPFSQHYNNYIYIIPSPDLMPPNNVCVEIKPFKIVQKIKLDENSTFGKYENYCIVDSFKEYKLGIPKPDIDKKDILYYCSENWVGAREDYLDEMLALQLVSCPSSLFGKGGLGAVASKISKHGNLVKSIVTELGSTYNGIIPSNFQKMNDWYYFSLIKNPSKIDSIKQERKRTSCEINYCKPCLTFEEAQLTINNIQIQIPMLITRAKYKKSNAMSEKYLLLQYQLTALMYTPNFDDVKKYKDNISKVIEQHEINPIFNIDTNSINKLALSFARLDLHNKLSNQEINQSVDLFFHLWNDWEPYISEINSINKSRSTMQATDINSNMTHDEQRFLVELRKLHDETNEKWIDREILEQRLENKIRNYDLFEIAQNLCNLGFIIQKNNFSKFQRLDDV